MNALNFAMLMEIVNLALFLFLRSCMLCFVYNKSLRFTDFNPVVNSDEVTVPLMSSASDEENDRGFLADDEA